MTWQDDITRVQRRRAAAPADPQQADGGGFFLSWQLPHPQFDGYRQELVLPARIEGALSRYAEISCPLHPLHLPDSPLSGLLIFEGPRGSGKTTKAKEFAQHLAERHLDLHGWPTRLLQLRTAALFSDLLGESSKAVAEIFRLVRRSTAQARTVLLIDELESVAIKRDRLSPGDPSDVVRVVNELLNQLDHIRGRPGFL